jgi:hypothetical protein
MGTEGNAPAVNAPVAGTSPDAAALLAENARLKVEAEKLTQRISGFDKQNQEVLRIKTDLEALGFATPKDAITALRNRPAAPPTPKIDTSKPDYFDEDGNFDPGKHAAWLDAKMDERESRKASEARLLAQEAAIKSGAKSIPATLLPKDDPDALAAIEAMIDGLTVTLDPTGSNPEAAVQATARVRKLLENAQTTGAFTIDAANKLNADTDHPAGAGGGAGGATQTSPVTYQQMRDAAPETRRQMMTDGVAAALRAEFKK